MTVRAFIEDGSTGIRETTLAEHNAMLSRISFLYQQNQPVTLSVVSSNGNISPNMTDTRFKSGTAARNTSGNWPAVTSYPSESTTGEPELVTGITYDKISQSTTTVPTFGTAEYATLDVKPIFQESPGVLREMTYATVLQYFIDPVFSAMTETNNTTTVAGGSYYISTAGSVSGSTQLGTVFIDTVANLAGYTAAGIGDGVTAGQIYQDVFTSTAYYLYRVDSSYSVQGSGYRTPLVIDYSANRRNQPAGLRHMTYAEFDSLFGPLVRYAAQSVAGYRLSYNVNGNGIRRGTQIANRQMIGVTGQYVKYEASANDYRAQEFPNGTIVVQDAFDLNIERT